MKFPVNEEGRLKMKRIERIEKFLNSDGMVAFYFILIIGILLISAGYITDIDWGIMAWFRFYVISAVVVSIILVIMVNELLNG